MHYHGPWTSLCAASAGGFEAYIVGGSLIATQPKDQGIRRSSTYRNCATKRGNSGGFRTSVECTCSISSRPQATSSSQVGTPRLAVLISQ